MAIARMPCVVCQAEELFNFVRGLPRCCQCNTSYRPLSVAEQATFNNRRVRMATENADAVARQRAKNAGMNFYIRSTPCSEGHFERYLSSEDCRQCTLAFHWRRYRKINPDATPRGRSPARDLAIEAGAKVYSEGPCPNPLHGYAPPRWTSNHRCTQCAAESQRARARELPLARAVA